MTLIFVAFVYVRACSTKAPVLSSDTINDTLAVACREEIPLYTLKVKGLFHVCEILDIIFEGQYGSIINYKS